MPAIVWNEAYNIGISEIDSQHMVLISIINDLYEAHSKGMGHVVVMKTLDKLTDYTSYHFTMEQQMHHDYKFPKAAFHKEQHSEFINRLQNLKSESDKSNLLLTLKTLDFMKDWLITHILGSDKAFGDYLREIELQ